MPSWCSSDWQATDHSNHGVKPCKRDTGCQRSVFATPHFDVPFGDILRNRRYGAYRVTCTTSIRRKAKPGHNSHPISAEWSRPSPRRVPSPYNHRNHPNVPNSGSRSLGLQGRNPGGRNSPAPITFLSRKVISCFEGSPTNGTDCGAVRIRNEWSRRSTDSGIVPTRNERSKRSTDSGIVPTRNEWSRMSANEGPERRATRCW